MNLCIPAQNPCSDILRMGVPLLQQEKSPGNSSLPMHGYSSATTAQENQPQSHQSLFHLTTASFPGKVRAELHGFDVLKPFNKILQRQSPSTTCPWRWGPLCSAHGAGNQCLHISSSHPLLKALHAQLARLLKVAGNRVFTHFNISSSICWENKPIN